MLAPLQLWLIGQALIEVFCCTVLLFNGNKGIHALYSYIPESNPYHESLIVTYLVLHFTCFAIRFRAALATTSRFWYLLALASFVMFIAIHAAIVFGALKISFATFGFEFAAHCFTSVVSILWMRFSYRAYIFGEDLYAPSTSTNENEEQQDDTLDPEQKRAEKLRRKQKSFVIREQEEGEYKKQLHKMSIHKNKKVHNTHVQSRQSTARGSRK